MAQKGEKRVENYAFNLKDVIGMGAFGEVFKGKDMKANRVVAVKMIQKTKIDADPYLRQSLMNEIKVMKKLKSEFIVQLIDILETTNNYYLIQEFCDSGDLAGLLKKEKKVPFDRAMKIVVDMLTGFQELIKHGVVHRDLKPANILINNKQQYKLADFGFAKSIDNFKKQVLFTAVGTPLYMSPQILQDEPYTTKSDIWSLAFVFYELIYGRTPWTGNSIIQLLKNINTVPLAFDPKVPISNEAKDFFQKCLQVEESKRISWEEIYRHPLFGNSFQAYLQNIKKVEDRANFLINDIRVIISRDQIDLEDLFAKFDMSNKKKLEIKDLQKLLNQVDKNLQREEVEFIFNKIDVDGSQSIEFDEFKNWLSFNEVMLSTKRKPQLDTQNTITINADQEQNQSLMGTDQSVPISPPAYPYQTPQQQQQQQQQYPQQQQFPQQQQQFNYGQQQHYQTNPQQSYPQQQYPQQQYPQQQYPGQNQQATPKQQLGVSDHTFERANIIIQKLITQIRAQKFNLNDLFRKYSKQDQYYLQNTELETMIRYLLNQSLIRQNN